MKHKPPYKIHYSEHKISIHHIDDSPISTIEWDVAKKINQLFNLQNQANEKDIHSLLVCEFSNCHWTAKYFTQKYKNLIFPLSKWYGVDVHSIGSDRDTIDWENIVYPSKFSIGYHCGILLWYDKVKNEPIVFEKEWYHLPFRIDTLSKPSHGKIHIEPLNKLDS